MRAHIEAFFHEPTCTFSYVISDPATSAAAVIDPVLDYDQSAGRISSAFAGRLINYIRTMDFRLDWILETHAHADHLTAASYIQEICGGRVGIHEGIREVQKTFARIFNLTDDFEPSGQQFDHLFRDDEEFHIGELPARVMHTPGHTNDSVTYLIESAAFVGDTLFMPDYGTARCDFPGGDARTLYRSIQRIFALPDDMAVYLCHDYPPDDRAPECCVSVAEQKADNIHIHVDVTEDDFVAMRTSRDAQLAKPQLIIPAIQINIRAGHLPPAEHNGVSYLKIPLNSL